ncbi:YbgC/FadM family acyl-CoA thioesterase [Geminicoccus harenae]|uniref:YbgC/FadM family acyl-CoA thioesterase n=1 Tax=Geminicoccus harenae TaxID=2498453 RepID=UPI001CC28BD8|nr:YbgC/FadM family acyl-CoA thioesterase [Geminicoccus harenae]
MTGPHRLAIRVYYEDTDAGGIVYHANFLRFAERGRTEWLRSRGMDHPTLQERFGLHFAVRRCDVVFLAPARLDDEISVETWSEGIDGARVRVRQRVLEAERELATLAVELVLVNHAMRPVRVPFPLHDILAPSMGT